jgi:hypothetical protein
MAGGGPVLTRASALNLAGYESKLTWSVMLCKQPVLCTACHRSWASCGSIGAVHHLPQG